jgi:Ion channel
MIYFEVLIINSAIVLLTILLHYEVLYHLAKSLSDMPYVARRFRVLFSLCVIFISHVVEIWIFGLSYYLMLQDKAMGMLVGDNQMQNSLMDCVYLSFVTYTTVGYGDLVVQGPARYLTGLEALTGLVLVTWTASFLFIEMQRYWPRSRKQDD